MCCCLFISSGIFVKSAAAMVPKKAISSITVRKVTLIEGLTNVNLQIKTVANKARLIRIDDQGIVIGASTLSAAKACKPQCSFTREITFPSEAESIFLVITPLGANTALSSEIHQIIDPYRWSAISTIVRGEVSKGSGYVDVRECLEQLATGIESSQQRNEIAGIYEKVTGTGLVGKVGTVTNLWRDFEVSIDDENFDDFSEFVADEVADITNNGSAEKILTGAREFLDVDDVARIVRKECSLKPESGSSTTTRPSTKPVAQTPMPVGTNTPQPVNVLPAMPNNGSTAVECLTSSGNNPFPILDVVRKGKNLTVSWSRTRQHLNLNIRWYRAYVLHNDDEAKKGDKQLDFATECQRGPINLGFGSYKPSSFIDCGSPVAACDKWMFLATISKIRDEANGLAVQGFDRQGRVRVFDYKAFSECLGCSNSGKVMNWLCKSGKVGLPLAETTLAFSKASLGVLGFASGGGAAAGAGSLILDRVTVGLGVEKGDAATAASIVSVVLEKGNINDAEIAVSKSFKATKLVAGQKIVALVDGSAGRAIEGVLRSAPKYKQVGRGVLVVFEIKSTWDDMTALVSSVKQWNETAEKVGEACAVWDY